LSEKQKTEKEPVMERSAKLTPKGKKLFDKVQQMLGVKENKKE